MLSLKEFFGVKDFWTFSRILFAFLFVDCLFAPIKRDYETKECVVYNILGILLRLWIQDTEGKHAFSIKNEE